MQSYEFSTSEKDVVARTGWRTGALGIVTLVPAVFLIASGVIVLLNEAWRMGGLPDDGCFGGLDTGRGWLGLKLRSQRGRNVAVVVGEVGAVRQNTSQVWTLILRRVRS